MVQIRYKELIINTITSSSGVFSGDNVLHRFVSKQKTNEGQGQINGDHVQFIHNSGIVIDTDVLDMIEGIKTGKKKK
jgi:hypothetical protein